MAMLEMSWESLKQTARDQQRQLMGCCIMPANLSDIQQMIDDFCEQPTPDSHSDLAERSMQLNRIIKTYS